MDLVSRVSSVFWAEWFWLPRGYNWTTFTSTPEKLYPDFYWIYFPIPFSLLLFLVRILFEKKICDPIGRSMGISERRTHPPVSNRALEKEYRKKKKAPDGEQLKGLSKRTDLTTRQVESWFRQRKASETLSQLQKFSETGWRFFYYTAIFIYGLWAVSSKSWFYDTKECWRGYPLHAVDRDMWWYYMLELSFYWSLLISQFFDVRRKDFWQMFTHHVTTILLLTLSWMDNLVRMGSLVLIIHDVADVFLEAAKLARYANKPKLCDAFFIVFAVVWIISRMFIYPYVVVYTALFEACQTVALEGINCFPAYYVFNALIICLQVLHFIWTWYIVRIAVKSIRTGKTDDNRSDTEEEDEMDAGTDDAAQLGGGDSERRSPKAIGDLIKRPTHSHTVGDSASANGNTPRSTKSK
ncbi:Ceramide synthase 5 [Hypsibius exemplaris]|uniref:Ceramide synthase 5 n=1 Tax=Hypsibius exemplaris TaxID=2072580 RepID=A0A1W0WZQ3_HYPEX|nr:Ceramide synthase 5 [Hypsibius exemplaris]